MRCPFGQRIFKYPGVAQLVARLLWEQDAASSSLATRTKHKREAKSLPFMFALIRDSYHLNAARVSAAGSGSTLPILYFLPIGKKMQSSLATRTISLWNHGYMVPWGFLFFGIAIHIRLCYNLAG